MKKLVAAATMAVAASLLVAWAGPGPLDGKFRSTACDAYGYDSADYTANREGDTWTFSAETYSPKWGTMTWKGTIKAGAIEGTATRSKGGKIKDEQVFSGAIKP